jgi:hypothetical protein
MGASGGSSEGMGFFTITTSSIILGFDLSGVTIPSGSGILTQVTFTDFEGQDICFGEDTHAEGNTVVSDGSGDLDNNVEFEMSGFMALPGGFRTYPTGMYNRMGSYTYFWTSTEGWPSARMRLLAYHSSKIFRSNFNKN